MKIVKLYLNKIEQTSLTFIEGFGIENDKKASTSKGKDKQIILCDTDEFKVYKETSEGLCAKRFFPHIATKDLDYKTLKPGTKLQIGSAEIEILDLKKRCFPECVFVQNKTVCNIKFNCAFAKVTKSGSIEVK
ncbi:MAG: hypothetical protein GX241_02095 [Ruminococcaceae bacterium]|nr:hypothetical protein [Oscillospiraceae bacterium]